MKTKATRRRMISCFAQIINGYVLGYRIPELAKREKIKARKLSYGSQMYLLMLGQFLHVFSLNELVDISKIYARELSRMLEGSIWMKYARNMFRDAWNGPAGNILTFGRSRVPSTAMANRSA